MDKSIPVVRMARSSRLGPIQQFTYRLRPNTISTVFLRRMGTSHSVIQPSFWKSMIPKPFRRRRPEHPEFAAHMRTKPKSKEWNPATFFIIIFLFIGSMSIQMIALRRDYSAFTRRAEVRIGILREVVEKLQHGEKVDVEKELGTGDAQKESEWEQVLRDIEREDMLRNASKKTKLKATTRSTTAPVPAPAPTTAQDTQTTTNTNTDTNADFNADTKKPSNVSSFF